MAAAWPDEHSAHGLAQGLGWFSIGLGVAEAVAPERLARFLGMEGSAQLIRLYGIREIVTGLGILTQQNPVPGLWARVGGDALDLATLAPALGRSNPQRQNVALAMAAVAGVTALDVLCAQALSAAAEERRREQPRLISDYGARRGMPRPPADMRGAAADFDVPRDMRAPEALRPYPIH